MPGIERWDTALNWDADEKIKKTILILFNILNSVLITDIMMTMTHTPGGGHGAARRGDLAHPPRPHARPGQAARGPGISTVTRPQVQYSSDGQAVDISRYNGACIHYSC